MPDAAAILQSVNTAPVLTMPATLAAFMAYSTPEHRRVRDKINTLIEDIQLRIEKYRSLMTLT